MRFETYKELPKEARQEWLFRQLENRIPHDFMNVILPLIPILNIFLTLLLLIVILSSDDRFSYYANDISAMIYLLRIVMYLFVLQLFVFIFNTFYRFYKEQKLIKKYRRD